MSLRGRLCYKRGSENDDTRLMDTDTNIDTDDDEHGDFDEGRYHLVSWWFT